MSTKLQRHKLSSLIDVKRGQSISGEYYASEGEHIRLTLANFDYVNGGFKVDTQKDDLYYTGPIKPECLLKKDDIITPLTEQALGLLGSTARIPESDKYVQSGDIALVTCKEGLIDPDFCYYLLPSKQVKKQLAAGSQQTKIRHTSPDAIKACVVDIPDFEQQKKIGKFLSLLDRKISLNRAINANLQSLAKQIYDYWFVQFDFPDENGCPYKSSGGKMVWNEKLKREIPAGWEASNILKVAEILSGGTPSKKVGNYWEGGTIPFFGPTDVNGNVFQIETEYHITEDGLHHCASSLYEEGVIIITARGSIGKLVVVGKPMAMNQSCYAFRSKKGEYEYLYFLTIQLIEWLKAKGSGSVFKSIVTSDIENSTLCIANDLIVTKFSEIIRPIFKMLKSNTLEISFLTEQRNELLPLLMNGQVTIE